MLLFYDFEVFEYDWMLVVVDFDKKSETIFHNERNELISFYEEHKEHIWIGYNSRGYDQFILRAIILDYDPKHVNDFIISEGNNGWQYSNDFFNVQLYNFDTQYGYNGLKTLEAFMGHTIEEAEVPWDINRPLTEEEVSDIIKYCKHDVYETMEVFFAQIENFNTSMYLIRNFGLDMRDISKTHSGLTAKVLGGRGRDYSHEEFDLEFAPTLRLSKYQFVKDWFEHIYLVAKGEGRMDTSQRLDVKVAGVNTTFAFGGIHGSLERYHDTGHFMLIDVTAYYPSMMILNKWGFRNMGKPHNFLKIHEENIRLKRLGDKKARQPYKIADNAIYGQLKDHYSKLYDPKYGHCVCVNGQLLLLDLIEKLEPVCKMITYNTDGIIIKLHKNSDFEKVDDIVYEFEERTGLSFDFEHYREVYIKDCNNYLLIDMEGNPKSIGAYLKKLHNLDNDLPIVNEAIKNYMVYGTPFEKTINSCQELIKFQKIYKVSRNYLRAWHNGQYLNGKTFRVFASRAWADTYLGKQKAMGETIEKFAGCPEHCFIDNGDILEKEIPNKLDRQYYINLCKERILDYTL